MDGTAWLEDNAEMKRPMNFGLFILFIWMVVVIAVVWKRRNTIALHWGLDPLSFILVTGVLIVVGTTYVWWANKRDSK
jgi:hypothetical protein